MPITGIINNRKYEFVMKVEADPVTDDGKSLENFTARFSELLGDIAVPEELTKVVKKLGTRNTQMSDSVILKAPQEDVLATGFAFSYNTKAENNARHCTYLRGKKFNEPMMLLGHNSWGLLCPLVKVCIIPSNEIIIYQITIDQLTLVEGTPEEKMILSYNHSQIVKIGGNGERFTRTLPNG